MVLSPSQQTESQSTCTVLLGGGVLGGRRGGEKPRDVRVCGEGTDKNQSWLWLVATKGVTAPSVVSPDLCPLLHIPHWLIAGSPQLRLWLRLAEILQCGISVPFFKDQPNDFHNKTMAGVRENT